MLNVMKFCGETDKLPKFFWKINKLNVFSYQNIFRQYPTNRKKVMTRFRHMGSRGGHRRGVGGPGSDPSKRHDLSV